MPSPSPVSSISATSSRTLHRARTLRTTVVALMHLILEGQGGRRLRARAATIGTRGGDRNDVGLVAWASPRPPRHSGRRSFLRRRGSPGASCVGMSNRWGVRWPARVAGGLAFASAVVSAYWTLGGGWLLDTVGGAIEDLARERSLGALALGATVVLLKVLASALAITLTRLPLRTRKRRLVLAANGAVAFVLCVSGAARTCSSALWS